MSVTFTQYPTYPVPGREVRLGFTLTTGDWVKLYLVDAPRDSERHAELQAASANRVLVHQGDANTPWTFVPDVSGKFEFMAQDVSKGATAYGGGYAGDPDSYRTETKNSEASTKIDVGTRCDMKIGAGQHTGTLRFYVWTSTIRETNEETHGEATPAIVNTSSERAEQAARLAATVTDLSDLIGQTATVAAGNTHLARDIYDNIRARYEIHRASAVFHDNADTDNTIDASYIDPNSPEKLAQAVAELQTVIRRHMTNDDGTGIGTGDYHQGGGGTTNATDWANLPVADVPSDLQTAVVALADLWRVYTAHRTATTHAASDTTALTALTANSVWPVIHGFISEIAKSNPTAGETDNDGAIRVAAELGMTTT